MCSGVALSLLLHVLMISPLPPGSGHPERTHSDLEGGAMSGVPELTVVDLKDSVDEYAERQRESEVSLRALRSKEHAFIPSGSFRRSTGEAPRMDLPLSRSGPEVSASDDGENALLFGRYLGQVTARIERAWLRLA